MRFDANRLAVLAGLPKGGTGLIKESVDEAADLGLFEEEEEAAGDEGHGMMGHMEEEMDDLLGDAVEEEMDEGSCNTHEGSYDEAEADEYGSMMNEEADEGEHADEGEEDPDEMVTVDENVLRREIMAMKQERLAESKIRQAVREEIAAILSEEYDDDNLYLTSDWLYGDNKPTNSRKGAVATALPGIGFKKV